MTLLDRDHAEREERWITLGEASTGKLVVMSHTFEELGSDRFRLRIISVRKAVRRERRAYEQEP